MIQVINEINAKIANKAGLATDKMQLFGLADPVIIRDEGDVTFPVIIDSDGECYDVLLDDKFDISLFHRLNVKSYQTQQTGGFGGDPKRICVYDMSLLVCGKRGAIDLYRLERDCVRAIEEVATGKRNLTTEAAQTDFNRIRVFATEYSGIPFPLQPNIFLFKINYKLTRIQSPC